MQDRTKRSDGTVLLLTEKEMTKKVARFTLAGMVFQEIQEIGCQERLPPTRVSTDPYDIGFQILTPCAETRISLNPIAGVRNPICVLITSRVVVRCVKSLEAFNLLRLERSSS